MRRHSLTWRVFRYNLILILFLILVTGIAFNIAVRVYVEQDTVDQLSRIARRIEIGAQRFRPGPGVPPAPPPLTDAFWYYLGLDRMLREPLTLINADYILLDASKQVISVIPAELAPQTSDVSERIAEKVREVADFTRESHLRVTVDDTEYVALVRPVRGVIGAGWIVIYSSPQRLNELRLAVNLILGIILLCAAAIGIVIASLLAKKIAAPFAALSRHIRALADRNFGQEVDVPVDAELRELVESVNTMSKRLQSYDQAQKTFLQNASHEFRTPITAIQSYAEGLQHGVVDADRAAGVILEEARRLGKMVDDLLYLSRLDALEEPYRFAPVAVDEVIRDCVERTEALAAQAGKTLDASGVVVNAVIEADAEKLSRALTNVLTNCIRYAEHRVEIRAGNAEPGWIAVTVADDGPGIAKDELPHIFDRFYKGRRGVVGLGLAITKHIVERHGGTISAQNRRKGAVFTIQLPLPDGQRSA